MPAGSIGGRCWRVVAGQYQETRPYRWTHRYLFRIRPVKRPDIPENVMSAANIEHEVRTAEPGRDGRERSPSAGPRASWREVTQHDERCRVAGQREGGAGDAEVRDGLPGRRRRHRDGGRDPGAVPAGPGAGQLDGYRGAGLDPGRVHLRAGILGRRGLQPAGLADPQDPHHHGRRGRPIPRGCGGPPRIPWSRRRWRPGRSRSPSPGRSAAGPDKLPAGLPQAADEILVQAARSGMDVRDLAGLAGEIYARSRPGRTAGRTGPGRRRSRTGPSSWRPRSRAPGSCTGT